MRLHNTMMGIAIFLIYSTFAVFQAFADSLVDEVPNLAYTAKVSAGSETFPHYPAVAAVDGVVPPHLSPEPKHVWATIGRECNFQTWFRLEWDGAQKIAEIVYYARPTNVNECFRDYEVYVDMDVANLASAKPIYSGTLEKRLTAQRITLPNTVEANSLTIFFKNAYTQDAGLNPGAAEIGVYPESPADEQLKNWTEKRTPSEKQLAADVIGGKYGFRDIVLVKRHHLNPSHVYTYHVEGYVPGGGLYIYTPSETDILGKEPKLRKILDSSNGMICDADISHDGKTIIFSWKQGGVQVGTAMFSQTDVSRLSESDTYHVWKINLDGTGLTRLTNGNSNNLNACWLPDGGIAFISDRKPAYAYCWCVTSPVLYRMEADGSSQKRLSSNYLMDFTPGVLSDGRIIFTRWEYVDRPAAPIQSLWTINPDGTNLAGYYGNRLLAPGTLMDTRAIPGSSSVICLATNHNWNCAGGIVVLDCTKGTNAHESLLNTTPEVDIFCPGDQWGNGLYGTYEKPFPLTDYVYLVSNSGALQVRNYDNERATLLPSSPDGLGFYSALPVAARQRPPVIQGGVRDESVLLPEDGSVSGHVATIFMQDVYNGLGPKVPRGTVKQLAVVQEIEKSGFAPFTRIENNQYVYNGVFSYQFPVVSCGATFSPKKVWGFVDVNEDGSACFQVPSEVPISFLALDAEGRAVQRMRTFTHLMPGEIQGCIGCHSDRNFATTTTGASEHAGSTAMMLAVQNPQKLQEPEWGVKGFSYIENVQPILDRHCIECHNAKDKPNGVDLSADFTDFFNVSYDILARKGTYGERQFRHNGVPRDSHYEGKSPYVEWIWTTNGAEWDILEIEPYRWGSPASLLTKLIFEGHPDENGVRRVNMSLSERKMMNMWMDLNVPYYPNSVSNYPEELGCRRTYPRELDAVLAEVVTNRCVSCHENGPPREFYTRVLNPEKNGFLYAPLAKSAGGLGKCVLPNGKAVFESVGDSDYARILKTFIPVQKMIEQSPRGEMPGFVPPTCTFD